MTTALRYVAVGGMAVLALAGCGSQSGAPQLRAGSGSSFSKPPPVRPSTDPSISPSQVPAPPIASRCPSRSPTGIFPPDQPPFRDGGTFLNSAVVDLADGGQAAIYVGSSAAGASVGEIAVLPLVVDGCASPDTTFSPTRFTVAGVSGPFKVTAVKGAVLTLRAADGRTFSFDVNHLTTPGMTLSKLH